VEVRRVGAGVGEYVLDGAPFQKGPGVREVRGPEGRPRRALGRPSAIGRAVQGVAQRRRFRRGGGGVVERGDGGVGEGIVARELDDVGRQGDAPPGGY
jgi:hypothetical protein